MSAPVAVDRLLADLRTRAVRLSVRGEKVHVAAPRGALTPMDRDALKVARDEIRAHLEHEALILDQSIQEFEHGSVALKLSVPWFVPHFWLVPRVEHVGQLVAQGIARGLIWTVAEMNEFLAIDGVLEEDRRALARLRARLGAEIIRFEPWIEEEVPDVTPDTRPTCRHSRRWRSIHNVVACGLCHPPASASLVAEWIDDPSGSE